VRQTSELCLVAESRTQNTICRGRRRNMKAKCTRSSDGRIIIAQEPNVSRPIFLLPIVANDSCDSHRQETCDRIRHNNKNRRISPHSAGLILMMGCLSRMASSRICQQATTVEERAAGRPQRVEPCGFQLLSLSQGQGKFHSLIHTSTTDQQLVCPSRRRCCSCPCYCC
jgi:hypothetical protein